MVTEIRKALFYPEYWGLESEEIVLSINDRTVTAKELKNLGISIPNLESISDDNNVTIIKAKEGKKVCIEGLITDALDVSEYQLKSTFGIGLRKSGNVTSETKGIEVKR